MTKEEIIAGVNDVYTQECVGTFSLDCGAVISTNIRRALEEAFNIEIPLDRFVHCNSGHRLVSLLCQLLPEPAKEVDQGIMTRNEIYVKLVALFKRQGRETFTPDILLGFDSGEKDSVELIAAIEDLFNIDMPDKDINRLFTGKSLIDLIEQLAINYAEPTLLTAEQLRAKIAERIEIEDAEGMKKAKLIVSECISDILKDKDIKFSDMHIFNCHKQDLKYVEIVFKELGYTVVTEEHSEDLESVQVYW